LTPKTLPKSITKNLFSTFQLFGLLIALLWDVATGRSERVMETDFVIENNLPFYVSSVEPHFVDEETKLSAKPVVPLESLRISVKRRKGLLLAGAFGLASFLGIAVALLSIQIQQRRAPAAAIAIEQLNTSDSKDETVQAPEPVATPEENLHAASPVETVEDPAEVEPRIHGRATVFPGKTPAKEAIRDRSTQEPLPPVDHSVTEDQEDGNVIAPEPVGPWEERRLRRVRRLERRAARQERNRDLLKIDEIFEGNHRPN
jgi:hypothetical protein